MKYEPKNPYTRKIEREFNAILFDGAKMVDGNVETTPQNIDRANDYLVMAIYGISQDELDILPATEYKSMLEKVGK